MSDIQAMANMHDSVQKSEAEVEVFREFVIRSKLPIDLDSIEKRYPPEPDILCRHVTDGAIAFELVELCDPDVAKTFNRRAPPPVDVMWLGGPDLEKIRRKFRNKYETAAPIELLCYTRGRLALPDSILIPTIEHEVNFSAQSNFRCVWYMGENETKIIYLQGNRFES